MPYNPQTMNLHAAQANAQASKDSFGTSGPQIIDAPQGTKYFAMKKDMVGQDIYLNIIPWGIETARHMGVHNGTAQIGQGEYLLEMWTHRVEGVTNGTTLCLQRMYGERCPYCEEAKNSGADTKASHRLALWVQRVDVYGNPFNGDPTPMLFITSYATFGKALLEAADVQGRRQGLDGPVPFADPSINGKIVAFRVSSKAMGNGQTFCEATNFEFIARKQPIMQNILATIPGLDQFIHMPTDKEIHDALYGATPGAAPQDYQQAQPQYQAPAAPAPAPYQEPANAAPAAAYAAPANEAAPAANPYAAPATPNAPAGQPAAANPFGGTAQVPHGQPLPQAQAAPAPMETGYPEPTF